MLLLFCRMQKFNLFYIHFAMKIEVRLIVSFYQHTIRLEKETIESAIEEAYRMIFCFVQHSLFSIRSRNPLISNRKLCCDFLGIFRSRNTNTSKRNTCHHERLTNRPNRTRKTPAWSIFDTREKKHRFIFLSL